MLLLLAAAAGVYGFRRLRRTAMDRLTARALVASTIAGLVEAVAHAVQYLVQVFAKKLPPPSQAKSQQKKRSYSSYGSRRSYEDDYDYDPFEGAYE